MHIEAATPGELPRSYQLLEVELPDDVLIATASPPAGDGWRQDLRLTRRIGDEWLAAGTSLLLRVPSPAVGRDFRRPFRAVRPGAANLATTRSLGRPTARRGIDNSTSSSTTAQA